MSCPISRSLAEMAAMLEISSRPLTSVAWSLIACTTAPVPLCSPRCRIMGLAPAATLRIPSKTIASASTVAVVVPSPAMSLVLLAASFSSWAPMFSKGSASSISLATVTPSWVTVGPPNFLPRATLRPLGPRVVLTPLATVSIPRVRARRASSLNTSCLGMLSRLLLSSVLLSWGSALREPAVGDQPAHKVLPAVDREGLAALAVPDGLAQTLQALPLLGREPPQAGGAGRPAGRRRLARAAFRRRVQGRVGSQACVH
jgi:hypothetical protein